MTFDEGSRVYEDFQATDAHRLNGTARVIRYYSTTETYKIALDDGREYHWARHMTKLAERQP